MQLEDRFEFFRLHGAARRVPDPCHGLNPGTVAGSLEKYNQLE
jgi:hypothetical protein